MDPPACGGHPFAGPSCYPRAFEQYKANLKAMMAVCAERKLKLGFIQPPFETGHVPEEGINPFNQVRLTKPYFISLSQRYLRSLSEIAVEQKVPVIDHRLSVYHEKSYELFSDLLHPVAKGYAIMAEDITEGLLAQKLVPYDTF